MALEHAILVSLSERSGSGYDLTRRFELSIGHFWQATHQQIYKVLGRMTADGWVSVSTERGERHLPKKVYSVTERGRDELVRWLATPTEIEAIRSDFAVQLRALHLADPATVRTGVARRLATHHDRLEAYRASAAQYFPDPDTLGPDRVGPWLVLRGGIRTEEAAIGWCEEILAHLPDA